jgi:hypothetical protein
VIDVRIVTRAGVLVDVLPSRLRPMFQVEYNETGKGQMLVRADDPILARSPALLDYGNVVRMADGPFTYAWTIEKKNRVLLDQGERSSWTWDVSGRGAVVLMQDAIVYPEYGLRREAGPERLFTFAAANGEWYDETVWPVATGVRQDSSTLFAGQPENWPDPAAQWLWATDPQGYVTPKTAVWIRKVVPSTTRTRYTVSSTAAGTYDLWLDGQPINSGGGISSWQDTTLVLEAGDHVFAARVVASDYADEGPNGAGFMLSVKETDTPTPTFLTRTDGSWRRHVEGSEPTSGWNAGQIVTEVLADAVARGVPGAMAITKTWTSEADSAGRTWPSKVDRSFEVGTDLLDVLQQLSETSFDWRFDADLNLFLYASGDVPVTVSWSGLGVMHTAWDLLYRVQADLPFNADWTWDGAPFYVYDWHDYFLAQYVGDPLDRTTVETFLTHWIDTHSFEAGDVISRPGIGDDHTTGADPLVLRPLRDLTEATFTGDGSGIRTTILVHNDLALTETTDADATGSNGRREGYLQVGHSYTDRTTDAVVAFALRERKQAAETITVGIDPTPGRWPLRDWREADWLMAPNDVGVLTRYRVRAVTVGEDDDGTVQYVPELATIITDQSARFGRWLKSVANGTLGGSVASASRMTTHGTGSSVEAIGGATRPEKILFEQDAFIGDGVKQAFTLAWKPTEKAEHALLNGIRQRRATQYGVLGTAIYFTDPPSAGSLVDVPYAYYASEQTVPVTNLIKDGVGDDQNSRNRLRASPNGAWWVLMEGSASTGDITLWRSPDLVNWQDLGSPSPLSGHDEFGNLLAPGSNGVAGITGAAIGNEGTVYAMVAEGAYYMDWQTFRWSEVDLAWSLWGPGFGPRDDVFPLHFFFGIDVTSTGAIRLWADDDHRLFTRLNAGAWTQVGQGTWGSVPGSTAGGDWFINSPYGETVLNSEVYVSDGLLLLDMQTQMIHLGSSGTPSRRGAGLPEGFGAYHETFWTLFMGLRHQSSTEVFVVGADENGNLSLYRSTDSGTNFVVVPGIEAVTRPAVGPGGTGAYTIGADDRLHVYGMTFDTDGNGLLKESSRPLDGSGSWSTVRTLATHPGSVWPDASGWGANQAMIFPIHLGRSPVVYDTAVDIAAGWGNGGATDLWRVTV